MAEAQGTAVTQDAQRRRDGMVAGVRASLDRVIEQAHHEACRAARTALAPATSPAAVREVRAELAYLRTFGDVYTERLQACLDDLLRDTGRADDHDGAGEGVFDVSEARPGRPWPASRGPALAAIRSVTAISEAQTVSLMAASVADVAGRAR